MKLRKTGGKKRKGLARLEGRIADWQATSGDCKKKHPNGYKKPGAWR